MVNVFLLLGSNLGDRQGYLRWADEQIDQRVGGVEKRSSVYETPAWGKTDAPDYLNQVLQLKTLMQPQDILTAILTIEQELGRQRIEKWGPRTIDIDLLFYGDEIIEQPNLTVPHPQLHNRKFTLMPMAEIAPDYIHPVLKKTIAEINSAFGY